MKYGNAPHSLSVIHAESSSEKTLKKIKKVVDFSRVVLYNNSCVTNKGLKQATGCSSAWLERLVWDQEVAGSNPVTPTSKHAGVVQW